MANATVDFIFLIDIIINFRSAYFNKEYQVIDSRKKIAQNYIKTWFFIDFLTIIPFDQILEHGTYHRLGRILRIGKIYKIVKMLKLARIAKIIKSKSIFLWLFHRLFLMGMGYERLFFLLIIFLILCHIIACLW